MSDMSMLTSIEGLINTAMGPPEKNIINYKMLQTVLYLLARHMRMLETKVQINVFDDGYETKTHEGKEKMEKNTKDQKTHRKEKDHKSPEEEVKHLKAKEKDKAKKIAMKEEDKIDKELAKEKEKYLKEKQKEKKELKISHKEMEKHFEGSEESEMEYISHKEEEKRELQKISPQEKQKYTKEKKQSEMEKISPKEKENYLKEKKMDEKQRKTTPEEKEKYIKEEEERELEKITPKEKEIYQTEKEKEEKKHHKMSLTEKEQQFKEKVDEAIKKKTEPRAQKGGNIDVATRSDFKLLEDVVMELKEKARPLPKPALPDSNKLRSDLAKGTASLTDTMEAMQMSARVQAVEQATDRMAGLLAQLAVAGALPEDIVKQLGEVKADMVALKAEQETSSKKPLPMGPLINQQAPAAAPPLYPSTPMSSHAPITHEQIDTALKVMKEDLMKKIQCMVEQANMTAETASVAAKAVANNFNAAMRLNEHIDRLHNLTTHHTEQLDGIGDELTTQMQSFKEQIVQMKEELQEGLMQVNSLKKNASSPAIKELTERFEGLSSDLEEVAKVHQDLTVFQRQLSENLQRLMEVVELLREEKADHDEMLDGLRDKADNLRLKGLVSAPMFESARASLEMKLVTCYGKFSKQEAVWTTILQELGSIAETKADITQLLVTKENAQKEIQSIFDRLEELAIQLGEPKAGMLTRMLAKEALSEIEALMDLQEAVDEPIQLPALPPSPEEEPCVPQWPPLVSSDIQEHVCKRWAGGSHTLVQSGAPREVAAPLAPAAPLGHYSGYGSDGRIYKMSEELLPCNECNKPPPKQWRDSDIPEAYQDGSGDKKVAADMGEADCSCTPTYEY